MKPYSRPTLAQECIKPRPPVPSMTRDVMAGPVSTFTATDPKNNTPSALLKRPGNLGYGTRMG